MGDTLKDECRNIQSLSGDPIRLQRLGKRISKAIAAGDIQAQPIRVALLSSFLTDMLVDALIATFFSRGLVVQIERAPYGMIEADLLSGHSVTRDCDLVLILPTHRDLKQAPTVATTAADAEMAVAREIAPWLDIWSRISQPIVQLTFDPPPSRILAEGDGFLPAGLLRHVRQVNLALGARAPGHVALLDAEALAVRVGRDWHDPRVYFLCKQPFAPAALSEIAGSIAASVAGVLGRARKVLVLDLDHTLWGGVIGDVGLAGITLGNESPEGEAFVAFQNYVKGLASRGVILAVCSKNNDAVAREPFEHHTGMVLKERDIACFVANFEDKATNLKRIAKALNVGLDSLVFVDDNPVEREWVSSSLPEVLVVDLPAEPAMYAAALEATKAFPMHRLVNEDITRNESYRVRNLVLDGLPISGDIGAFLAGLDPVAVVEPVNSSSQERIAQLLAKTNQFKLNPHVFSSEQILNNAYNVLAVRFKDRTQDYGITSVAVVEKTTADELMIINWVMSCRVFSRRLEDLMLELIRNMAKERGASRIRADFQPSAKNAVAKEMLLEIGFLAPESGGLVTAVVANSPVRPHFMRIEHSAQTTQRR
jgi:FkbH-like protein